jgi:hypothetical protein
VPAAPRRPLNPLLLRRVYRSGKPLSRLALVSGWPYYTTFHDILRAEAVPATPLTAIRLQRVADAVRLPRDETFLDEQEVRR